MLAPPPPRRYRLAESVRACPLPCKLDSLAAKSLLDAFPQSRLRFVEDVTEEVNAPSVLVLMIDGNGEYLFVLLNVQLQPSRKVCFDVSKNRIKITLVLVKYDDVVGVAEIMLEAQPFLRPMVKVR